MHKNNNHRLSRLLNRQRGRANAHNDGTPKPLPLSKFRSLDYPLQHAKLVGLYFAASWCPHSTPVTEALDEYFGDIILSPPRGKEGGEDYDEELSSTMDITTRTAPLAIVHVSSDHKEQNFQQYIRRNWIPIPFDSPDKNRLKSHFLVCSRPEVAELGIDRKHEIPTLLIIDSETQSIVTTNGVEDLEDYKEKALDHWIDLHDLLRAMEEKYAKEEEDDYSIHSLNRRHDRPRNNHHHDLNGDALSSLFGPN
jgi:hypothetical protein